ncbi:MULTISPECIES: hypothetical protein [Agrobacterium]|uniref:Uncharacterized protein n=1 Tax=Agrobacterium pusense TaxID=648995 RepID=A0A6H0ZKL4_9HYPH|nr:MULTISPECIES: hypothetical protein [Agrobacterium]MDP9776343.1 hypothetical protein [Rhizobium sp. SORGH_AS_0755]MBA8799029.1 hypothetical protein [Agrobacterium sp. RC10-4-1]MBP2611297.1 hypothetical protein [Agrobacterium pusense]MCZ7926807.1 hypothetical protein [Agrobacterium pusense]MDH0868887.1 hypothetical protein [Agrobacterium pusense]
MAVINLAFLLVFLRQNGAFARLARPIYRIIAAAKKAAAMRRGKIFPVVPRRFACSECSKAKNPAAWHFYYVMKRQGNRACTGAGAQSKVNEINRNLTILTNSGNYVFMALAVL